MTAALKAMPWGTEDTSLPPTPWKSGEPNRKWRWRWCFLEPKHKCTCVCAPPRSTTSTLGGPRPWGPNSLSSNGPQPSHAASRRAKASVHVHCLEQHIRSPPCHLREVNNPWEDPTRSDVTCWGPTWTPPSPSVRSHLGSSQRRR